MAIPFGRTHYKHSSCHIRTRLLCHHRTSHNPPSRNGMYLEKMTISTFQLSLNSAGMCLNIIFVTFFFMFHLCITSEFRRFSPSELQVCNLLTLRSSFQFSHSWDFCSLNSLIDCCLSSVIITMAAGDLIESHSYMSLFCLTMIKKCFRMISKPTCLSSHSNFIYGQDCYHLV